MTAIEIVNDRLTCICHEMYKSRDMIDPNCIRCDFGTEIADLMEEYAKQHAEKLAEALRSFTDDDGYMAYEALNDDFKIARSIAKVTLSEYEKSKV